MDKETLFKEIRRGQVLLWAGSGFSYYAGYPMGAGLVERLYQELSSAQRQRLADALGQTTPECPKIPLPDFAQRFIQLHGNNRERLTEVVTEVYSAAPTSQATHDRLAAIPYFDKIVTTNYDPLFELAYGSAKLQVVIQADNVSQIGRKPVALFKIHGDINRPSSLIISRDDYTDFFSKADEMVWTQLRALISTRTVVFVGYAVEDPNVLDVFMHVVNQLGQLMRPAYVIGPRMDAMKVEDLRSKNVHFIQATGEEFVEELWEEIKKKALPDLAQHGISVLEPVSQTLINMGLDFKLSLSGNKPVIDTIRRKDGPTQVEISFSTASIAIQGALQGMVANDFPSLLEIPGNELTDFSHKVEGFSMPVSNISYFWIAQAPLIEKLIDIRFESGLAINDVELLIYNNKGTIRIVALNRNSRVGIKFQWEEQIPSKKPKKALTHKIKFEKRNKLFATSAEALESTSIMQAIGRLEQIYVFEDKQLIWKSGLLKKLGNSAMLKEADQLMRLVIFLPLIELRFGIMFQNFSLNGQDISELAKLGYLLTKARINVDKRDSYSIVVHGALAEDYTRLIATGELSLETAYLGYEREVSQTFSILGWGLRLTWIQHEYMFNPDIKNINDGTDSFRVSSRNNRIVYECTEIIAAVVVGCPVRVEALQQTQEEQIKERLPRF